MTQTADRTEVMPPLLEENISNRDGEIYGSLHPTEAYVGERGDKFGIEILDDGCNFAIRVGANTTNVDLCFPDPRDPTNDELCYRAELERTEDTSSGGAVYTGFVRGLPKDTLYYVRREVSDNSVSYDTPIIDPYAKAITRLGQPDSPDSPMYCVVADDAPDIPLIERPVIDPKDRVIYETHIRDATINNLDIPEELRGTYLGFVHPENIKRLKELGITTVELLPIHQFVTEPMIRARGMVNHWGYNTVGFFAPHEGYASSQEPGAQVRECKMMISALHEAGLEVILDVVYNHTADGPHKYEADVEEGVAPPVYVESPTYLLRGLGDEEFYGMFTNSEGERVYWDTTGVGHTLDTSKPAAAQLVRDSLRFWRNKMGVDGVRFDLAPSVGDGSYFESLIEDPELQGCRMIAEPWDYGHGSKEGMFVAHGLSEWSGRFRDAVRDFWRGGGNLQDLYEAMAGLYGTEKTVNFVTAHDGFTLADLVSYDQKHNDANLQKTNNGEDNNRSYNHGVEGPTDDPGVNRRRKKTLRNIVNTLLTSLGTPMLLGGDEVGHGHEGNNNPYCRPVKSGKEAIQSRPGALSPQQQKMFKNVAGVIAVRKSGSFGDPTANKGELSGSPINERGIDSFNLWGYRMTEGERRDPRSRVMGMYVSGRAGSAGDSESYLTYVNGGNDTVNITLPQEDLSAKGDYVVVSDSETGDVDPDGLKVVSKGFVLGPMSSVVLKRISSQLPKTDIDTVKTPKIEPYLNSRVKTFGANK